jgi:hypothetical protein
LLANDRPGGLPMDNVPDGSIVITPKEFYDGVRADIGGIRLDVSAMREDLSSIPARVEKLEVQLEALDKRVGLIDRKIVYFAGFAAGAGGTVGTLLAKFMG